MPCKWPKYSISHKLSRTAAKNNNNDNNWDSIMIYELLKRLGIFPERGCNYASVQSVWRRRRTPLAKGDNVAKWPKWPQNGVAAQMWLLSSSFTHWAQLVFMGFSLVDWFKWKWQCDSSKPWPGSAIPEILQHPETLPPYSPPLAPPSTSSSTAGVAQTQLIQIVFMLSLCLYLCLSVCMSCMSVLFTCLSVCLSLCLSIRLNSPSNCSVLYDLFRSITRSLVTESGSDITLWFRFDLLCSWFELLFGFYF